MREPERQIRWNLKLTRNVAARLRRTLGQLVAPFMDKQRKKQMLREWQERQRAEAREALPMPDPEMLAMFDMLDVELPRQGCDHTRRITQSWLEGRGHDVEKVLAWLNDTGGYCDCEVLANSEDAFLAAICKA